VCEREIKKKREREREYMCVCVYVCVCCTVVALKVEKRSSFLQFQRIFYLRKERRTKKVRKREKKCRGGVFTSRKPLGWRKTRNLGNCLQYLFLEITDYPDIRGGCFSENYDLRTVKLG